MHEAFVIVGQMTSWRKRVVTTDTLVAQIHDSRSNKVHTPGEEVAEVQGWLAVGLAMIAGFVDAYGIITYDTYLSFMSGNTTHTGYKTGQGDCWAAVPSALAIVFFVGGSFAGALLAHSGVHRIRRLVFGVVAILLALIVGFAQLGFSSGGVPISVLSFAMGAMNAALPRVAAQNVSLIFVTGTLSRIGVQLALAVRRAPLPDSRGSWVSDRRIVVGDGDNALWGVGTVVSHAHPVGARGVRPHYERGSLISRPRSTPRGDVRSQTGLKSASRGPTVRSEFLELSASANDCSRFDEKA
jgi:uncharacterized membrane protein YoaK (UPF0700 family)